ncbi:cysteine proteinase, partial [Rhizoclosmatium globosum]
MIRKDGDVVETLSLSSATIRGYRLAHEKAGMLSIKPYDSQIEHVFLYENNADSQEFLEVIEMDGDMHLGNEKFDYYIQALTFNPHCSTKEICSLWEGVPRLPFARSKSPARIPLPGSKSSTLKHTATSSSSTSFVQSKTTDLDPEEEDELQLQIAIQESLETGNETQALPEEPKGPVNIMTPPPSSHEITGSPHSSNEVILVYPSTGTNLVSLHQEDLNRLKEGEFLNDSLIEFYIRWTTNTYAANAQNFHIFNTFFYQTLTTKDEGAKKLVIEDTFMKVRRWTRKFNIFEKDFLIIPINERVHWYLAVIWKPGAFLAKESDGQIDVDESEIDKCRIFVFDSLQGKHPTIGKNLFAYLAAEAKDKN